MFAGLQVGRARKMALGSSLFARSDLGQDWHTSKTRARLRQLWDLLLFDRSRVRRSPFKGLIYAKGTPCMDIMFLNLTNIQLLVQQPAG